MWSERLCAHAYNRPEPTAVMGLIVRRSRKREKKMKKEKKKKRSIRSTI